MNSTLDLTCSLADQHFQRTKSVGILNFSVHFLGELAKRSEIRRLTVLDNSTLFQGTKLPPNVERRIYDTAISGRLGRIWWDQVGVYRAAKQAGNKWLFLPKGFASFLRNCPVRLAAYLADVMPEYYQRKYPTAVSPFETRYFLWSMAATLKQAQVVFTNSDFSRREILRVAKERGWPEPRLRVMGIGFVRGQKAVQKEDRVFVLASSLPHKRTAMTLDYMTQWQQDTGYKGIVHWVGRLLATVKFPDFQNWKQESRLEDGAYRDLQARAKVLIFASEYEGFGMPPVEAVLSRTCPVYSSIPATQEVMSEAGCPFSNDSYQSFAAAMDRAFTVSNETMDAWAEQLLSRHNWDKVVDVFLSEIESADKD